jgi:hypothetical protein
MDLVKIFILISYTLGSVVGVIIWEVFLREQFKKK